jgi:hypothetical protein
MTASRTLPTAINIQEQHKKPLPLEAPTLAPKLLTIV